MDRMISPEPSNEDLSFEKSLRPQYLSQYIGQEKVKHELAIYIEAAKKRGDYKES